MKCPRLLTLLPLLALALSLAFSQDALQREAQGEQLQSLSLTIKDRLLSLRQESLYMSGRLEELSTSLETSQAEQAALAEELMKSSASLTSINEELMSSYESIERLQAQVKRRGRVVLVLGIIFGVMVLAKVAGYILYAYGVKLPRWLDILL